MLSGQREFAQLMEFLPRHEFDTCVRRYGGDRRPRGFSCRDQFLCLAFGQLTFRESLRDIETCLRAVAGKRYHAGFRGRVSRSTLADANRTHDWRIFADFAQVLIRRARALYAEDEFGVALDQTAYALDSTTIDLCLNLFPWARFRRRKGAVKLHTLLDLRGNIPCFIRVTHGKTHDVTVLDHLPLEPGAFYVMDRGYTDFQRLHTLTTHAAFFVTRAKKNLDYTRRDSRAVDKTTAPAQRSNDRTGGTEVVGTVPRSVATHRLSRRRARPTVRVPDEQPRVAGAGRRATVPLPLASRIVLQMDQATFADQSLLRHEPERGQDPGVDRRERLRAGGYRQTRAGTRPEPQRNPANPQPHVIRKNPCFSGVGDHFIAKSRKPIY